MTLADRLDAVAFELIVINVALDDLCERLGIDPRS